MQQDIRQGTLIIIYLLEIVFVALFSTVPHEFLGHAVPLWIFGYGVKQVGFVPPFGAFTEPATSVTSIPTLHLYPIVLGGILTDIVLAFFLYQGLLYFDPNKHPEHKVILPPKAVAEALNTKTYDITPVARQFCRVFSGILAGSVLTNAMPLFQFAFRYGGISFIPTIGNDGSTYLWLTFFRATALSNVMWVWVWLSFGLLVTLALIFFIRVYETRESLYTWLGAICTAIGVGLFVWGCSSGGMATGEWIGFGFGVATISFLMYAATRIVLGFVRSIFGEQGKEERKLLKSGQRIKYRGERKRL